MYAVFLFFFIFTSVLYSFAYHFICITSLFAHIFRIQIFLRFAARFIFFNNPLLWPLFRLVYKFALFSYLELHPPAPRPYIRQLLCVWPSSTIVRIPAKNWKVAQVALLSQVLAGPQNTWRVCPASVFIMFGEPSRRFETVGRIPAGRVPEFLVCVS